ncbi:STAS domain-containing protein [Salmonella enterica]|uniref:Anti-sigma factor antagonist n=2 Tax=Salmonella enterica TaxID=28901 RepID=A0A7U7QL08_SALER|nr:STAS domain-containing protein [Salmonella enterica]ECM2066075.1 STAS domain-containing protein [Salmonella enterica subsp. enterica serovar Newport]EHC72689.1 anti sigma b factor antagonist RsbV [Salmonella enterica subsp. enterica serovar Mississippi str. A4-633]EHL1812822.1 STAS domain-containing protein [Salmonella enterica subsp. diarizonae]EID9498083.1 STAS domain-containing protein [Salmonella enterica subsp. enterica serovar Muenster]EAA8666341.1 anti-sigma factor antagonist [Salmon
MNLEILSENGVVIVVPLVRRLDASVALTFKEQVQEVIGQNNKNILLDFSHVDFIDSSCLGALVSILKSLNGKGDMVLCSLNSNIYNLFKLTRMDRIFSIRDKRQDALQMLMG